MHEESGAKRLRVSVMPIATRRSGGASFTPPTATSTSPAWNLAGAQEQVRGLAVRRKPSGTGKPVGLRPSATRKTATLFARGRLPSAGLPGSTELTVTLV